MAVLVVLLAARAVSTVCWEGSPYVLYGAWVGLFCAFLDPQNLCGIFRCLYGEIGTESAMGTVPMDLPVPKVLPIEGTKSTIPRNKLARASQIELTV